MCDLERCAVPVRLVDAETNDLGVVDAPRPVASDLVALADGPALRVVVLAPLRPGDALAEVEQVAADDPR